MIVMPIRATGSDQIAGAQQKVKTKQPVQKLPVKKREKAPVPKPEPKPETPDPIEAVKAHIAEAKQALDAAGGSLKTVRLQREDDQVELSGFRSLFNSIKRFATGGK